MVTLSKTRFGWLKNTGDKIAGATGFVLSRSSVFGGPQGHGDSVEDAPRTNTGDKDRRRYRQDVKLRAERKLGGRAEALAPHRQRGSEYPL